MGTAGTGQPQHHSRPAQRRNEGLVNTKIKFREPFRPFAPSVAAEEADKYFELPQNSGVVSPTDFMLLVSPVLEDKKDLIPAVNHMGTSRVQTVHEGINPLYHKLIKRFGESSGVPIIMNTSFNVRGEPMVNTPDNALDTFLKSGIDTLVMGNFVVDTVKGHGG